MVRWSRTATASVLPAATDSLVNATSASRCPPVLGQRS
jgi:hypothetical protein